MKTGSSSVRQFLTPFSEHMILEREGLYAHHWNASKYKKVFVDKGWEWSDYYSFTTIRNPWARIVSFYKYGKPDTYGNHSKDDNYDESTAFSLSFKEWLKIRYNDGDSHRLLPNIRRFAFIQGKQAVTEIHKIEDLKGESFSLLLDKCGILNEVDSVLLPTINQTASDDYRAYYDSDSVDIVSKAMKPDIEIGGYSFGD
jgi:hypothetical protein